MKYFHKEKHFFMCSCRTQTYWYLQIQTAPYESSITGFDSNSPIRTLEELMQSVPELTHVTFFKWMNDFSSSIEVKIVTKRYIVTLTNIVLDLRFAQVWNENVIVVSRASFFWIFETINNNKYWLVM